jgi:hypothetical protein
MDAVSCDMELLALPTTLLASFMSSSAWRALSAFCLVMEDISSRDADVSSMEAACSDEPSASNWLEEETSAEAEETWSAP